MTLVILADECVVALREEDAGLVDLDSVRGNKAVVHELRRVLCRGHESQEPRTATMLEHAEVEFYGRFQAITPARLTACCVRDIV